jgi:hypothetical protein
MFLLSLQDGLYFIKLKTYYDTIALICIFTWFDYPGVVFVQMIAIFSYCFWDCIVLFAKFEILVVLETSFDVKSKRQVVKYILLAGLIVLRHCTEQSFFVSYDEVVDQMIMNLDVRSNFCHWTLFYIESFCSPS